MDLKNLLFESYEKNILERQGDIETRKDAHAIISYIVNQIENNKIKPVKSSDGTKIQYQFDLEPVSKKFLSTLNLVFIKDLKADYVARYLPDTKVLLLPIQSFKSANINKLALEVIKTKYQDLFHEIIHYIDSEKYDVRKAYNTDDYVNTHPELNAYFHEVCSFFEKNKKLISKDPIEFIKVFWKKLAKTHSGDLKQLTDDNKKRLVKRIYQFHQEQMRV
jgi:hypothetical protein